MLTEYTVWILIMYLGVMESAQVVSIDDLPSQTSCEQIYNRVRTDLFPHKQVITGTCIQRRKVVADISSSGLKR